MRLVRSSSPAARLRSPFVAFFVVLVAGDGALASGGRTTSPNPPGPPDAPDSLLTWATGTDEAARGRFVAWARSATLEEYVEFANLAFERMAPMPGDSIDKGFAWPMLWPVVHKLLENEPHPLRDAAVAIPKLTARLRETPEDPGALLLLGFALSALGREDVRPPLDLEDELTSIRPSFRIPPAPEAVEYARLLQLKETIAAAEKLGVRTGALSTELDASLRAIFHDPARNAATRSAAVGHFRHGGDRSILPDLYAILAAPATPEEAPLRFAALHAIGEWEGADAQPVLMRTLATTSDERLFGAAAAQLSHIGGEEALRALVENEGRLGGGRLNMYIRSFRPLLLEMLEGSDLGRVELALRALRRVDEAPRTPAEADSIRSTNTLLLRWAARDSHRAVRNSLLLLLADRLSREEAQALIEETPLIPEYEEGWNALRRKSRGTLRTGRPSEVAPPGSSPRGTEPEKELGDPGYRRLGFLGEWPLLGDFGHTGIFAGVAPNPSGPPSERIIEVSKVGSDCIASNSWEPMECGGSDCWGVKALDNAALDFADRRLIVETARALLESHDIGYPIVLQFPVPDVDAIIVNPFASGPIDPWEIDSLRCDGLVEYCFERAGFDVWGPYGAPCSIASLGCYDAHNDLFVPYLGDPITELAPSVQCGREDPFATHLDLAATASPPHTDLYVDVFPLGGGFHSVDLALVAADESGIHRIAYSTNDGATWTESPAQPQFPESSTFTFYSTLVTTESFSICYFAMDGAGNVPSQCDEVFVCLTCDNPAAAVSSPDVGASRASWVVESEHATREYVLETGHDLAGPWQAAAREEPGAGRHEVALPSADAPLVRLVEVEESGRRIVHGHGARGAPRAGNSASGAAPAASTSPRHALRSAPPDSLRAALRALRAASPPPASLPARPRSLFGKDLLLVTVDEFLPDVEEFVESFWEDYFGYEVDVVSLGAPTDLDAAGRRSFVRSLVTLYTLSLATKRVLLVGDANDWQEFDGPLTPQYWVGPWAAMRDDLIAAGCPAGGQPELNLIPTYAIPDPEPRGENMAYVVPYVLSDAPYTDGLDTVVTRWPCSTVEEVLTMSLKMQLYNRGIPVTEGVPSALCYVGDLDFDDPGDGALASRFGESLLAQLSTRLEPHGFYRSGWSLPFWLIGEAANLWNSLPGLRLVATVGSLSTRYRPVDILNKEEWSFPFDVNGLLTGPRTPLVLGASCSTADFARTERWIGVPLSPRPIVEDFLFTAGKGAVAWVGPTCGTWQLGNEVIAETFVAELFADWRRPMADSWRAALRRIADEYPASHPVHETVRSYVFLGDPLSPFEPPVVPIAAAAPPAPREFALAPIAPNPFRDCARIAFDLPVAAHVQIDIYDVRGRRVRALLAEARPAGRHEVEWPGFDDEGLAVAPGIYFARARSRGRVITRKLVRTG